MSVKLIAAILAMIVMLVSVFPVSPQMMRATSPAAESNSSCHQHCKKSHSCSNDKENNACQNGSCNPFSICNCFPVVIVVPADLPAAFYGFAAKKMVLFDEGIYSAYHAECWHPPETT